nr:curli production assembly/transport protein CsgE [Vibrio fluvialis]
MSVVYAFSLSFLLASASVSASQEDSGKLENNQQLENNEPLNLNDIDGLIIDRTMTRFGNNFYTEFSRYINDQHEDLKENLTVKERATASQGSIISVWHAQKLVYRTTLSPGARQAQEKAKAAIAGRPSGAGESQGRGGHSKNLLNTLENPTFVFGYF